MKLKTVKAHYYEHRYRGVGEIYMADKIHGEIVVKRGLCEKMELPKRKDLSHVIKMEDKSLVPKTRTKKRPAKRRKPKK
jgi:hypothetical protein